MVVVVVVVVEVVVVVVTVVVVGRGRLWGPTCGCSNVEKQLFRLVFLMFFAKSSVFPSGFDSFNMLFLVFVAFNVFDVFDSFLPWCCNVSSIGKASVQTHRMHVPPDLPTISLDESVFLSYKLSFLLWCCNVSSIGKASAQTHRMYVPRDLPTISRRISPFSLAS